MKNTVNVSKNVNLILNTYRCIFLKTATEEHSMLIDRFLRQRGNGKVLESALRHSKLVNHNDAKIVEVWNVKKLSETRTKMEVSKLPTKAVQ